MPDERIQLDNGMGGVEAIRDHFCERLAVNGKSTSDVYLIPSFFYSLKKTEGGKAMANALICGLLNKDIIETGYFYQLNHAGVIDRVYYASDLDRQHIKKLYGLD
jgi:hypothetical protein